MHYDYFTFLYLTTFKKRKKFLFICSNTFIDSSLNTVKICFFSFFSFIYQNIYGLILLRGFWHIWWILRDVNQIASIIWELYFQFFFSVFLVLNEFFCFSFKYKPNDNKVSMLRHSNLLNIFSWKWKKKILFNIISNFQCIFCVAFMQTVHYWKLYNFHLFFLIHKRTSVFHFFNLFLNFWINFAWICSVCLCKYCYKFHRKYWVSPTKFNFI